MSALPKTQPLPVDVIRMYVGEKMAGTVQASVVKANQSARGFRRASVIPPAIQSTDSPYMAPRSTAQKKSGSHAITPLFTSKQVAIGAFLGGPLVAGMLLAANCKATKRVGQALAAIAASVLLFAALIGIGFAATQAPPAFGTIIGLGIALLAKKLNESAFGDLLEIQKDSGRRRSNWTVVGACLAAFAIIAATVYVAVFVLGVA